MKEKKVFVSKPTGMLFTPVENLNEDFWDEIDLIIACEEIKEECGLPTSASNFKIVLPDGLQMPN
jgi:hypothetical protein